MPLPKPTGGDQKKWISSCMSNETMKKEYPKQKQRLAVCYSQWRRRNKAEIEEIIKSIKEELIEIKSNIVNKVITPPLKNIRKIKPPKVDDEHKKNKPFVV